jgi:hypothetical protein
MVLTMSPERRKSRPRGSPTSTSGTAMAGNRCRFQSRMAAAEMLLLLQRASGGDEDGHARRSYRGWMRTRASRWRWMECPRACAARLFMSAFRVPRQIIHCHFPSLLELHAFFYVFLLMRTVEFPGFFSWEKRKREMLHNLSKVFLHFVTVDWHRDKEEVRCEQQARILFGSAVVWVTT